MKLIDLVERELNWELNPDRRYDRFPGITVLANVEDIWANVNPEWLITNSSETNRIGKRFDKAVQHFQSNQPMDPPVIAFSGEHSRYPIQVVNGRHRIAAAVQLGQQWIPIIVDPKQLNDIKQVIHIK